MIDIERLHKVIDEGYSSKRGAGQTFAMFVKVCQTLVDVDRTEGETGNYLVVCGNNPKELDGTFKLVADLLYRSDTGIVIVPINTRNQFLVYRDDVLVSALSFITRDKLESNYTSYTKMFDDIFIDNGVTGSKELDSKVINCLK